MVALPAGLRGPVEVALAEPGTAVPTGKPGTWVYELKWDGFRCAVVHDGGQARLWSRQGKDLTAGFPEIAEAVRDQVLPGTVLDGELVIWDGTQIAFEPLSRRLTGSARRVTAEASAHPATLMVFDVLAADGHDLRARPWTERREVLDLFAPGWDPPLQASPVTDLLDVAQDWARLYRPAGIEGLVAKRADGLYRPGRRDWVKVKTRETTEVIIGAVTGPLRRPDTLVAGRIGTSGQLRIVGRSTPLTSAQAKALAAALHPAEGDHPWPDEVPANRFGSGKDRVRLTKVIPAAVAEVSADTARHHGTFRHPIRFVRLRPDLTVDDVPTGDP